MATVVQIKRSETGGAAPVGADLAIGELAVNLVDKKIKTVDNLHIIYRGFQYDYGVGGIHGCISAGVYDSCDKYMIIDIDVSSFYPNLAIRNRFYPLHLGIKFCDIYESVYDKRSIAKKKYKIELM